MSGNFVSYDVYRSHLGHAQAVCSPLSHHLAHISTWLDPFNAELQGCIIKAALVQGSSQKIQHSHNKV